MRDIHKFPKGFDFRTRKNHEYNFRIGILEKVVAGVKVDYRWQIVDDEAAEKENVKHALDWFKRWERKRKNE